jgi:hypothetical protein
MKKREGEERGKRKGGRKGGRERKAVEGSGREGSGREWKGVEGKGEEGSGRKRKEEEGRGRERRCWCGYLQARGTAIGKNPEFAGRTWWTGVGRVGPRCGHGQGCWPGMLQVCSALLITRPPTQGPKIPKSQSDKRGTPTVRGPLEDTTTTTKRAISTRGLSRVEALRRVQGLLGQRTHSRVLHAAFLAQVPHQV